MGGYEMGIIHATATRESLGFEPRAKHVGYQGRARAFM